MLAIDPNTPPPLPPEVTGRAVRRIDNTRTQAVTVRAGAKLLGVAEETMQRSVNDGRVEICYGPAKEILILIDSLWLLVPEEDRRVP